MFQRLAMCFVRLYPLLSGVAPGRHDGGQVGVNTRSMLSHEALCLPKARHCCVHLCSLLSGVAPGRHDGGQGGVYTRSMLSHEALHLPKAPHVFRPLLFTKWVALHLVGMMGDRDGLRH